MHCTPQVGGLPAEALVWTKHTQTKALEAIKHGDQVLGLDSGRFPALAYADVESISYTTDGLDHRWVRVELEDGSELVLLANHPVWTTSKNHQLFGPVHAENLAPYLDALPLFSLRPCKVRSVTPVPREESPVHRIQITIDRASVCGNFAILVAQSGEPIQTTFGHRLMAVADCKAPHAIGSTLSAMRRIQRALAQPSQENETILLGNASSKEVYFSSCNLQNSVFQDVGKDDNEDDDWSSTASTCSTMEEDSPALDPESPKSQKEDHCYIILGGSDTVSSWSCSGPQKSWRRQESSKESNAVKLSDVLSLPKNKEQETLSYGSIAHCVEGESCKVCVFKSRGRECRHGILCKFCHAEHSPYMRRKSFKQSGSRGHSASCIDV